MAVTVECNPLVFQKAQTPSSYLNWFIDYNEGSGASVIPPTWMQATVNSIYLRQYVLNCCINTLAGIYSSNYSGSSSQEMTDYGYISTIDFNLIFCYKYDFTYAKDSWFDTSIHISPFASTLPNTFILWTTLITGASVVSIDVLNIWQSFLQTFVNKLSAEDTQFLHDKLKTITFYPISSAPYIFGGSLQLTCSQLKYLSNNKTSANVTNTMLNYILNQCTEGGSSEGYIPVNSTAGILFNFDWDNNSHISVV